MPHATVQVPATTANLGPGFDAFGLALARYLVVRSVDRRDGTPRVTTLGEGDGDLARGDDNLIWRSASAFAEEFGVTLPDVALEVVNDIPLERGLGSSSSAIVAGLVLARAITGVEVGDRDLLPLADRLEGHPDNVAPALLGGLVACAPGSHGELVVRRRNPAAHLRPMTVVPATRQVTTEARDVLPDSLPRADVATQAARAGHVIGGLLGAWPVDPAAAGDVLHEPPRLRAMAATGAVLTDLRDRGIHAWLSGAGPSVAAMVAGNAAAAEVGEIAAQHGFTASECRVDLSGAFACLDDGCALSGLAGTCVHCPRQRLS